jgi:hypothetical protein
MNNGWEDENAVSVLAAISCAIFDVPDKKVREYA